MVKLEQGPKPLLVADRPDGVNGGVEVQPQPASAKPEVVVFQNDQVIKTRPEIMEEKRKFVKEAWERGWNSALTEKQRLAVERYLEVDDSGSIPSLEVWSRRLRDNGTADITRQALFEDEKAGLMKFARLQRGEPARATRGIRELKMDPTTRDLLLQNKRLPMKELSCLAGHSIVVVRRFRDELEIPRNPNGRPRKSDPSSE